MTEHSTNDRAVVVAQYALAKLGFSVPATAILAALREVSADAIAHRVTAARGDWMSFPGPATIHCPGAYRGRKDGAMLPCGQRHGRAPAGSVAYIRIAGQAWRAGSVTQKCGRCGCSFELLCLSAGEAA